MPLIVLVSSNLLQLSTKFHDDPLFKTLPFSLDLNTVATIQGPAGLP
jgi:hypothetical protein